MLYVFKLLLLLINIDQETVLNWFGIENAINQDFSQSNFETSTDISLTTFRLIFEGLLDMEKGERVKEFSPLWGTVLAAGIFDN